MTPEEERELLIEQVVSAWRPEGVMAGFGPTPLGTTWTMAVERRRRDERCRRAAWRPPWTRKA